MRLLRNIFAELTFENYSDYGERLMEVFENGTFDKVIVVYNKFIMLRVKK